MCVREQPCDLDRDAAGPLDVWTLYSHTSLRRFHAQPDEFLNEQYALRQILYQTPRRTELFIVLTMYNVRPRSHKICCSHRCSRFSSRFLFLFNACAGRRSLVLSHDARCHECVGAVQIDPPLGAFRRSVPFTRGVCHADLCLDAQKTSSTCASGIGARSGVPMAGKRVSERERERALDSSSRWPTETCVPRVVSFES